MKSVLSSAASPTFTPGAANAGTLNFATAVASYGFQFGRLLGVINLTQNAILYTAGVTGFGGSWNSGTSVLTLAQATTGMGSSDVLEVIWDDPAPGVVSVPPSLNSATSLTYHYISTAGTNATVIKASPGVVSAIYLSNTNINAVATNTVWRFYDTASTPVIGTTPIKFTFVGAKQDATYGSTPINSVITHPVGIKFSSGIAFTITGGTVAASDATSAVANSSVVNVVYV